MKAFVIGQRGGSSVERADVEVPHIDDDELLVRVHAVGVGIHDSYFLPRDASYPYPIGIEASGVIEQVGSAVRGRAAGQRVAFVSSMQPKGGTWAEFVAVRADSLIMSVPPDLGFVEAAAIPVAGNTALKALHALSGVPDGGSVFFAGGSGAIGTLAIQLARMRGWRIAASASVANHDYLRELGADMAVDYADPQWTAQVLTWAPGGVDAAIAVQPATSAPCLSVVRDGGTLVSVSGDQLEPERGIRASGIPYQADIADELSQLMNQVASGAVHVELEQVYPFDDALDALAKVQTRHARGKQVLRLA